MTALNLLALREANKARLPQFKNNNGDAAHSKPDGSDWSPMMWMIALMGEVGETAETIYNGEDKPRKESELADIQIYLDILGQRITDKDTSGNVNPNYTEVQLMSVIMTVGAMCELHKKYVRGDIAHVMYTERRSVLKYRLYEELGAIGKGNDDYKNVVEVGEGVNLASATIGKFNRTSAKVGSNVLLWCNSVINDGNEVHMPKLRNADDLIDSAVGLRELPPIRLKTAAVERIEHWASQVGVPLQTFVRDIVENYGHKRDPEFKGTEGWSTGKDNADRPQVSPVEALLEAAWRSTMNCVIPKGVRLEVQWDDGITNFLTLTDNLWWIDDTHMLHEPPNYWRMPQDTQA